MNQANKNNDQDRFTLSFEASPTTSLEMEDFEINFRLSRGWAVNDERKMQLLIKYFETYLSALDCDLNGLKLMLVPDDITDDDIEMAWADKYDRQQQKSELLELNEGYERFRNELGLE